MIQHPCHIIRQSRIVVKTTDGRTIDAWSSHEFLQPRSQVEDKPEEQPEEQEVPEINAMHQLPDSQEVPTAVL